VVYRRHAYDYGLIRLVEVAQNGTVQTSSVQKSSAQKSSAQDTGAPASAGSPTRSQAQPASV
jgi:hypothetical protein